MALMQLSSNSHVDLKTGPIDPEIAISPCTEGFVHTLLVDRSYAAHT